MVLLNSPITAFFIRLIIMSLKELAKSVRDNFDCHDILAMFGIQTGNKNGKINCPFPNHDDHDPSFSIYDNGNRWKCFVDNIGGDCINLYEKLNNISNNDAIRELADKAGITQKVKTKNNNYVPRIIELIDDGFTATQYYDYVDTMGKFVFQVVRLEHKEKAKEFIQRTAWSGKSKPANESHNEWCDTLKYLKSKTKLPLYNLPGVTREDKIVWVEGEKDVLSLKQYGIVATTNSGGSGNYKNFDLSVLSGKDVVIIPDNDVAGYKGAVMVCESILKIAKNVSFAEVPLDEPKSDVTDYVHKLKKDGKTDSEISDELKKLLTQNLSVDSIRQKIKNETADKSSETEMSFWFIDGKTNQIKIDVNMLLEWLEDQGFAKVYLQSDHESSLIKLEHNIAHEVSKENIIDYTLNYLDKTNLDVKRILRPATSNYLGSDKLKTLKTINKEFQRDAKEHSFIYFKNGFVKTTKDKIELLPYDMLNDKIWHRDINPRDFQQGSSDGVFSKFIELVCAEDSERVKALRSAIGYLLHRFKEESSAKAIILCDESIESENGGTGKGIIAKAIGRIVPTQSLDFKHRKSNQFVLQDVKPDTRVVHFNDVPERFDFRMFFNAISDDMEIEKKNDLRYSISFENSPKFMISSNFAVTGEGDSHVRRKVEYELCNYFNPKRTPYNEFGHALFREWDELEWGKFDNYMVECVQLYLNEGLIEPVLVNMAKKKLIASTHKDFVSWCEQRDWSNKIDQKQLRFFIEEDTGLILKSTQQAKKWLKQYAEYAGYAMEEKTENDSNGKTCKMLYLTKQAKTTDGKSIN